MAARATRSAGRAASSSDDASRCLLLALSHDELGVIFDGLADPLQPVVAVAFSSTCLGLRTPLRAALEVLAVQHEKAEAWCRRHGHPFRCRRNSCTAVLEEVDLTMHHPRLTGDGWETLGMILRTRGLPKLRELMTSGSPFGAVGMPALCDGLGRGSAPSLRILLVGCCNVGPAGAEALAAALNRGVFPQLDTLMLYDNPLGAQGIVALAPALRKLPELTTLNIHSCDIGDEGVASMVDNLGKDDFKKLEKLDLCANKITDASVAKLLTAINAGGLPKLGKLLRFGNSVSDSAVAALDAAPGKRSVVPRLLRRADLDDGRRSSLRSSH